MRGGWGEITVEKLVNQKIIEKPLDGNHGEIHPKKSDFTESGIPFVMASDLVNGVVNQETCNFISRKQADSLRKGFAKNGDVLLSHKGTIGRSAILHTSLDYVVLTPQVTYYRILDNSLLDNRFLYYAFHSPKFQREIKKIAGTGSTRAYIGITQQLQLHIPLASLAEQKRIVAILDEAFEGIDRAIANTEKNLANSRELFESYLNAIFTQKGDGWISTTVGNLVDQRILNKPLDGNHGEIHPKKSDFVKSGVPFIMASDLVDGVVNQVKCNFITLEQANSLRKGFAQDGDVLLSHKGTIGRVAVLKTSHPSVVLTPQVTYYRVRDESVIYNRYLYYFFHCPYFQKEIKTIAGAGSTRAYIGITSQLQLEISYPRIDDQKRYADSFDALISETQRLESIYRQKIAALKELKQSILQKAFTGELTADTPKTVKENIAA